VAHCSRYGKGHQDSAPAMPAVRKPNRVRFDALQARELRVRFVPQPRAQGWT
jgi:hypothetical protein